MPPPIGGSTPSPHPRKERGGLKVPGPMDDVRRDLLAGLASTKVFLSGHVGSGKSTELNRLAVDPAIARAFKVVRLQLEAQEWAALDASQLLFRIGSALFDYGKAHKLLSKHASAPDKKPRWAVVLEELNDAVFGKTGIEAKEGKIGPEFDVGIVKLKQELALSEGVRKLFRDYGETHQSRLQDLITSLVEDIKDRLPKDGPLDLLLIVDDLDKVRGAGQQKDIFDTHLNALLKPEVRIVYTLPSGVKFGETLGDLRYCTAHLYPIGVLKKAPATFDAEAAFVDEALPSFRRLVDHRVEPQLVNDEALRLAAVYSGGVLRDCFHLLREAIDIAVHNELDTLTAVVMKNAVKQARLRESAGLYENDYTTLTEVHRSNALPNPEHARYLDQSRVLERYNDGVWFEVNPLLWKVLGDRASRVGKG
jgi:hypothetical protein